MNVSTIAQLLSAGTNMVFVIVIAVGYYMMIKLYRQMVKVYERMVQETEAQGAAREISFEFSAPIESSDGTVISDLAYFKNGLGFMSPGGEISAHWDHLDDLLPLLEEKGLTNGIGVTTRYKDLAGRSYETEWNLNPYVYRDDRYVHRTGLNDVVDAIRELSPGRQAGGQEIEEAKQG